MNSKYDEAYIKILTHTIIQCIDKYNLLLHTQMLLITADFPGKKLI